MLCEIGEGDEVIMPSFTFVSTANAFTLRGATPVFVDIRADTLNIDETKIEAAITPRTKAIVAVHYAGVGCDISRRMSCPHQAGSRSGVTRSKNTWMKSRSFCSGGSQSTSK